MVNFVLLKCLYFNTVIDVFSPYWAINIRRKGFLKSFKRWGTNSLNTFSVFSSHLFWFSLVSFLKFLIVLNLFRISSGILHQYASASRYSSNDTSQHKALGFVHSASRSCLSFSSFVGVYTDRPTRLVLLLLMLPNCN